eukprot:m.112136 g.112136  ORF g.112136 m.112136 type:complete len:1972 (+) comp9248_c1_seq1:40-5955(+)
MTEPKEEPLLHSTTFRHLDVDIEEDVNANKDEFAFKFQNVAHLRQLLLSMHEFVENGILTWEQYKEVWDAIVKHEILSVIEDDQRDVFLSSVKRISPDNAVLSGLDEPSYNTALVLVPDKPSSAAIQNIRKQHDQQHVDIWPAHISLFYPFVHPAKLKTIIPELEHACENVSQFQLSCQDIGEFNQGKKRGFVTYLDPKPEKEIHELHNLLSETVSKHMGVKPFKQAHITIARGQAHSMVQTISQAWNSCKFNVNKMLILQRDDKGAPMKTVAEVNFGGKDTPESGVGDIKTTATTATSQGLNTALKLIEQCTRAGHLTWARALQLRKIVLFPNTNKRINSDLLTTLEEETELARAVFGATCFEENDMSDATVINISYTLDGAQSDILVDCKLAICAAHPMEQPSGSIIRVVGLPSSISLVFQQALDSFSDDWMNNNAYIGKERYSGTFVFGVYQLIDELVRGQLFFNMKKKKQGKDQIVFKGLSSQYSNLLTWREMTNAIVDEDKKQEGMDVKRADGMIYEALLKHLDTFRDEHSHRYKLISVENIVHPHILQRFNNRVEENAKEFVSEGKDGGSTTKYKPNATKLKNSQKKNMEKLLHQRKVQYPNEYDDSLAQFEEIKRFAPRLAFHGTCNTHKAESIARDGLKASGEFTSDGVLIQMATGAVLGPGAYVSPSFQKSHWYSYSDANGHFQMIVGLVVPGKCCLYSQENIDRIRFNGETVHNLDCSSHLSPSKDELVLYDSEAFLPCLLVNYSYRENATIPVEPKLKGSVEELVVRSCSVNAHLVYPGLVEETSVKKKGNGSSDRDEQEISTQQHGSFHRLQDSIGPSHKHDLQYQLGQELWLVEIPAAIAYKKDPFLSNDKGNHSANHVLLCFDLDLSSVKEKKKKTIDYLTELRNNVDVFLRRVGANTISLLFHDAGTIISSFISLNTKKSIEIVYSAVDAVLKGLGTIPTGRRLKATNICEALEEMCSVCENKKSAKDTEYAFSIAEKWLQQDICSAWVHPVEAAENIWDERANAVINQSCFSAKEPLRDVLVQAAQESGNYDEHKMKEEYCTWQFLKSIFPADKYTRFLKKRVDRITLDLCSQQLNIITCFVPPFVGDASFSTPLYEGETMLTNMYGRMSRSQMIVLPLVIKAGKLTNSELSNANAQSYLFMKNALQTLSVYESTSFYHAQRSVHMSQVCSDAARFIRALSGQPVNVSIAENSLHSGFLTSLISPPQQFVSLSPATSSASTASFTKDIAGAISSTFQNSENVFCLFRGRPSRHFFVNGTTCNVTLTARESLMKELQQTGRNIKQRLASKRESDAKKVALAIINSETSVPQTPEEVQSAIAAALISLVTQLKELVAHKHESVRVALCFVAQLLEKLLKEQSVHGQFDKTSLLSLSAKMELMATRRQHFLQVQSCLNMVYTMCSIEVERVQLPPNASWIVLAKDMKHGARAMRRAKVIDLSSTAKSPSAMSLFNLNKAIKNIPDLERMCKKTGGDVSKQSKLSTFEHVAAMVAFRDAMSAYLVEDIIIAKAQTMKIAKSKKATEQKNATFSITKKRKSKFPYTNTQLLYAIGMTGVYVNVQGSQAANVNPWEIRVSSISTEFGDTSSSLCTLDVGGRNEDSQGNLFNSVLPLTYPNCVWMHRLLVTKLFNSYHAIVCTQNPLLTVPQQRLALLCASLSQLIAQMMVSKRERQPMEMVDSVRLLFRLMLDISLEVGYCGLQKKWDRIVTNLVEPMPGRFLTEAEGDEIASVVQVIAALLVMVKSVSTVGVVRSGIHRKEAKSKAAETPVLSRTESMICHDEQVEDAALAVLAESVSRGVRIQIKQKANLRGKSEDQSELMLLRHCLGIGSDDHAHVLPDDKQEPSNIPHGTEFNLEKAKLRSGKFFRKKWTNCAPAAVVGAFGLVNILHEYLEDINTAMESEQTTEVEHVVLRPDEIVNVSSVFGDDEDEDEDEEEKEEEEEEEEEETYLALLCRSCQ